MKGLSCRGNQGAALVIGNLGSLGGQEKGGGGSWTLQPCPRDPHYQEPTPDGMEAPRCPGPDIHPQITWG